MDDIDREFSEMQARFTHSGLVAFFELPPFSSFRDMMEGTSVLDDAVAQLAERLGLDPEDPHAMVSAADMSNTQMYIMDEDMLAIPRPDDMEDDTWVEWLTKNNRVAIDFMGDFMISTIFTGMQNDDVEDGKLYNTAVFIWKTRTRIEGAYSTNSLNEAISRHSVLILKYGIINREYGGSDAAG